MSQNLSDLLEKMRLLEKELEVELARKAAEFHYTVEDRKVRFEAAILERQKRMKVGLLNFLIHSRPQSFISAPFIYFMIFPLALLDFCISFYQLICFPLYGISRVRRSGYFIYDRELLPYLNLIEKVNCLYCSYATGLFAYLTEITALTELYWCPIKHARRVIRAHSRYGEFFDFGDANSYSEGLGKVRDHLREEKDKPGHL